MVYIWDSGIGIVDYKSLVFFYMVKFKINVNIVYCGVWK